jgi:hypothetical protein
MAIEGRLPALRLAFRAALIMTYGTSYFRSMMHAVWYYKVQYGEAALIYVPQKVKSGEIHIGMPPLKKGETCYLIDNGCRWAVNTNGAKP